VSHNLAMIWISEAVDSRLSRIKNMYLNIY